MHSESDRNTVQIINEKILLLPPSVIVVLVVVVVGHSRMRVEREREKEAEVHVHSEHRGETLLQLLTLYPFLPFHICMSLSITMCARSYVGFFPSPP